MPNELAMPIWDHLDELRERVIIGALAAALAILTCFAFAKELVVFLEAPVASQGVRFLQLSPGEFFFTTMKVGILHTCSGCPTRAYVLPAQSASTAVGSRCQTVP